MQYQYEANDDGNTIKLKLSNKTKKFKIKYHFDPNHSIES